MNKAIQVISSGDDTQFRKTDELKLPICSDDRGQDSNINLHRLHLASDSELEDYKGSQENAFL